MQGDQPWKHFCKLVNICYKHKIGLFSMMNYGRLSAGTCCCDDVSLYVFFIQQKAPLSQSREQRQCPLIM